MVKALIALLAPALALGLGVGCAAEFVPASVVVNERVIAVIADPPEAVPGQQVTLTPLVVAPGGELVDGETYAASWWRCPDEDSDALGDFVQCTDPSDRTEVGTGVPYVDSVPFDIFGELPDAPPPEGEPADLPSDKLLGALLGYWRVVGLTMTVSTSEAQPRRVDAFKRIPVYPPVRLATLDERLAELDVHVNAQGDELPPNTNPIISAVSIHEDAPDGATTSTLSAQPGKKFFLQPIYDEDVLEEYISLRVNLEGLDVTDPAKLREVPLDDLIARFDKVQRCEIPTFSWFVTHGRVRRDSTLDEGVVERVFDERNVDCPPVEGEERFPEVEYTPPTGETDDPRPADGVVRGWVVMRDGRGGTAVRSFEFALE